MTTFAIKGAAMLLLACGLAAFAAGNQADQRAEARARYDATIGAGGFNLVYPIHLGAASDMRAQMKARYAKIEALLRGRDVSDLPAELQAERARNLDRLHAYRLRGEFPANESTPNTLTPCFIDRNGNICAVGYLIEQSLGRPAAERFNAAYKFAAVNDMHSPELDRWIAGSGFTHAEIATIQAPSVDFREPEDGGKRVASDRGNPTIRRPFVQQAPPADAAPVAVTTPAVINTPAAPVVQQPAAAPAAVATPAPVETPVAMPAPVVHGRIER